MLIEILNGKGEKMNVNYWATFVESDQYMRNLGTYLRDRGHAVSFLSDDAFMLTTSKGLVFREGDTRILARDMPFCSPFPFRRVVFDMLQFKLERCRIDKRLRVVDADIFPSPSLPRYAETFMNIFAPTFERCETVEFVTSPMRNIHVEEKILCDIRQRCPSVDVSVTYMDGFRDRYWIADDLRGVSVNSTSENNGKQYTILDDLDEDTLISVLRRRFQPTTVA